MTDYREELNEDFEDDEFEEEENWNFLESKAFNFAAVVGFLYLSFFILQVLRFIFLILSFDCGRSCAPWFVFNDLPFETLPKSFYICITLCFFVIFVILCFWDKDAKQKKSVIKNSFANSLLKFVKMLGFIGFCMSILFFLK